MKKSHKYKQRFNTHAFTSCFFVIWCAILGKQTKLIDNRHLKLDKTEVGAILNSEFTIIYNRDDSTFNLTRHQVPGTSALKIQLYQLLNL